jgi:hypothetical protein
MASARQVVAILNDILNIGESARFHAESLRTAGLIPSTQGKPTQLDPEHIALLLISVLLGEPCAAGNAELVDEYAAMRPTNGGEPFGKLLASFIERPEDFFELRLMLDTPTAVVTFRQPDRGMTTIAFRGHSRRAAPAFERFAVLDGNLLATLSAAIRNAPPVKAGRRRRASRFSNI